MALPKGVSTGGFTEALQALLGPSATGLSAATITRLITTWQNDYEAWNKRSLAGKHYVYVWADGIHFNVRLEEDRQCILVLMGATVEGKKELIAVADGYRESEQSWRQLLLDCKERGLTVDPKVATGDGALGFWKALRRVYSTTRTQRCRVHKTANVLTDAGRSMVVCGLCYVSTFLAQSIRSDTQSALIVWIPIFVFGTLAMVLMDRVKT